MCTYQLKFVLLFSSSIPQKLFFLLMLQDREKLKKEISVFIPEKRNLEKQIPLPNPTMSVLHTKRSILHSSDHGPKHWDSRLSKTGKMFLYEAALET